MTSLKALEYLDDIAHGRKMTFDAHELKLLVEKELKALEIIKKYVGIKGDYDDLFPYTIVDKQYVSNRSALIIKKEEYELLKEVLK